MCPPIACLLTFNAPDSGASDARSIWDLVHNDIMETQTFIRHCRMQWHCMVAAICCRLYDTAKHLVHQYDTGVSILFSTAEGYTRIITLYDRLLYARRLLPAARL